MSPPDGTSHGTETTCARHSRVSTRLRCSECDTPICPRCAVETVVGQKCPTCARPERSARRRGKPEQYAKAVGFGVVAAGVVGVILFAFFNNVGFFTLIGSGIGGYGVARAVDVGAEGNRAQPFLVIAIVLSVVMVAGVWIIGYGILAPQSLGALSYLAAPYGAWMLHRR